MTRTICACLLLAGVALSQVTFEAPLSCAAGTYPAPCGAAGGLENVSRDANATGLVTVDNLPNGAGFPSQGAAYGRIQAFGPSGAGGGNHMYIPIPAGSATISFEWDFYDAEGGQSGFNDGMQVDVLSGCGGASLAQLVYIDDNTFVPGNLSDTTGGCGSFATEQSPIGVNSVFNVPLPVGAALLQVSVWNGGDNAVASHGVIDNVCFVGCVPPPPPNCILHFSSPLGPGSLKIDNTPCPAIAFQSYQIGVTFSQGAFPTGWFFGLDITLADLYNQHGPAFGGILWGALDGVGASSFGPVPGLPSGLQIWAVSSTWSPAFGASQGARPPTTYTIP
jgi:hypothetical protein